MTGTTSPVIVQLTIDDDGGTTYTPASLDDVTPPILDSISPNSGLLGTSVNNVTLTGIGLAGATGLNPGSGITISNFKAVSNTTITATFTIAPSAATGARNVSVTTPGGTSNNVTFTVVAPVLTATVTPTSLNFVNQPIGTVSAPQTLTVTNTGNVDLAGIGFSFGGTGGTPEFSIRTACGAVLAVGASCTLNVVFSPTFTGAQSLDLVVSSTGATVTPSVVLITGIGI